MNLLQQLLPFLCLISSFNCTVYPNETGLNPQVADEAESEPKLNYLRTSPIDLQLSIGDSAYFDIYLTDPLLENISISLSCAGEGGHCNTFDGRSLEEYENYTLTPSQPRLRLNVSATEAGHDVILVKFSMQENALANIIDSDAFLRIRVGHSDWLGILGLAFGWIYFVTWSVSFYPQGIHNFRRKSVVGLNFDYALLHWSGFIFYSIFNIGLYFSAKVQEEYEEKFPRSEIPVELNDVVYSVHALASTSIPWAQCFIYERGNQRVSIAGKIFQSIVWFVGSLLLGLSIMGILNWLNFIYFFSYVKLIVTALKYLPQVIFNIRRKSTAGWSIYMIYLDLLGGSMSMLQMLTIAYNYNDWKTLLGNLPKLGLAIASMFYDVIFLLQEYVFYPNSGEQPKAKPRNSLARLSLRSSFHATEDDEDDDDGETLAEYLRKRFSVHSVKSAILRTRHNSASDGEHLATPGGGGESPKLKASNLSNHLEGGALPNGRSRSLTIVE